MITLKTSYPVNARRLRCLATALGLGITAIASAEAATVTDPNDPRNWQGATVGTFATLFYGTDTLANRQLVVDNELLDDGLFGFAGATGAALIQGTGATGQSLDSTGTGSYGYLSPSGTSAFAGSSIDDLWVQTGNTVGGFIWDLGASATKAAIFNTIDHGPLPQEAIESTVFLSNDKVSWTPAVTQKVWLEGFKLNTGILWDGYVYAVGTDTLDAFRYASIIWGGSGALQADGDNEINGIMGLDADFTPVISETPIPAALPLLASGFAALGFVGRKRRRKQ
jgi:hypothetical protein